MLQSMGSQRVGHDLVTEKNNVRLLYLIQDHKTCGFFFSVEFLQFYGLYLGL